MPKHRVGDSGESTNRPKNENLGTTPNSLTGIGEDPRREEVPSGRESVGGSSRGRRMVVAALQMSSGPVVERNIDAAVALLEQARERGADIAGLPENFSFMGRESEKIEIAEDLEGPTVSTLRESARGLGLTVLAGTFPERSPEHPGKTRNTSLLIDSEGEVVAVYRKIHLFDIELDEAQSFRESGHIARGEEVVAAEAGGILHGLTVCYDLRFPELYRRLDLRGAQLVWAPSAFTLATGKDHWEVLIRARAIENGAYLAAPAQFGKHSERRITYGNAMVVDPWGKVLARASDKPNVMALAEVDLDYREDVRRTMPTWRHHVL